MRPCLHDQRAGERFGKVGTQGADRRKRKKNKKKKKKKQQSLHAVVQLSPCGANSESSFRKAGGGGNEDDEQEAPQIFWQRVGRSSLLSTWTLRRMHAYETVLKLAGGFPRTKSGKTESLYLVGHGQNVRCSG